MSLQRTFHDCFPHVEFSSRKLTQQLPQVTKGTTGEVQSSAVTHTAAPTSPPPAPPPAPIGALSPAPATHLPTTEEPSPPSLQQPATSTTETPVSIHNRSVSVPAPLIREDMLPCRTIILIVCSSHNMLSRSKTGLCTVGLHIELQ